MEFTNDELIKFQSAARSRAAKHFLEYINRVIIDKKDITTLKEGENPEVRKGVIDTLENVKEFFETLGKDQEHQQEAGQYE